MAPIPTMRSSLSPMANRRPCEDICPCKREWMCRFVACEKTAWRDYITLAMDGAPVCACGADMILKDDE